MFRHLDVEASSNS